MYNLKIGQIETPLIFAKVFASRYNLLSFWLDGKTFFDPTCGSGNLFEAIVDLALEKNYDLSNLHFENFYGCELDTDKISILLEKFKNKYGVKLNEKNFVNCDFITEYNSNKFDLIFGNPPWLNFNDLPGNYKEILKKFYIKYKLVENKKNVLLGGSRIDIASLIIKKAIIENLKDKGLAIFYFPLSILLNDGANHTFRNMNFENVKFCINEVYDFKDYPVFQNIKTRNGLMSITKNKKQNFPITAYCFTKKNWEKKYLYSNNNLNGAFIYSKNKKNNSEYNKINKIQVEYISIPRQGINTCGANYVYFFEEYFKLDSNFVKLKNKFFENLIIEKQFVYPVLTKSNFENTNVVKKNSEKNKWVILPYNTNGKVLDSTEIIKYKFLYSHFIKNKEILNNRKGIMLNSFYKKNIWWSMLGVGVYNFYKFKLAWYSYGSKEFEVKLFNGIFQANQALQCYMPFNDYNIAKKLYFYLNSLEIKNYFKSFGMDGTMSFAQPSKVKSILNIVK